MIRLIIKLMSEAVYNIISALVSDSKIVSFCISNVAYCFGQEYKSKITQEIW